MQFSNTAANEPHARRYRNVSLPGTGTFLLATEGWGKWGSVTLSPLARNSRPVLDAGLRMHASGQHERWYRSSALARAQSARSKGWAFEFVTRGTNNEGKFAIVTSLRRVRGSGECSATSSLGLANRGDRQKLGALKLVPGDVASKRLLPELKIVSGAENRYTACGPAPGVGEAKPRRPVGGPGRRW